MTDIRRIIVGLVIGSFSFASLLGIAAVLGGSFGEGEAKILLTTLVIGLESLVALCLLPLVGHRWEPLAAAGGIFSVLATGTSLALVWGPGGLLGDELLWKSWGTTSIAAGTCAQMALLIALVLLPGRGGTVPAHSALGTLLAGTGLVATLVAVLTIGPILAEPDLGTGYAQLMTVLLILDVLGTVVVLALGAFGRTSTVPDVQTASGTWTVTTPPLALTGDQVAQLTQWAAIHATTPDRVLAEALAAHLTGAPQR